MIPYLQQLLQNYLSTMSGGDSSGGALSAPGSPPKGVLSTPAPQVKTDDLDNPSTTKQIVNGLSAALPLVGRVASAITGPTSGWGVDPAETLKRRIALAGAQSQLKGENIDQAAKLSSAAMDPLRASGLAAATDAQMAETAMLPGRAKLVEAQTNALNTDTGLANDQFRVNRMKPLGDGMYEDMLTGERRGLTKEEALQMAKATGAASLSGGRKQQGGAYYDENGRLVLATFDPSTGAYTDQNGQPISTNANRAEDDEKKYGARAEGKQYEEILTEGRQATSTYQDSSLAIALIEDNPNLYLGTGGDTVQMLQQAAVSFGIAPERANSVADTNLLTSMMTKRALEYVNQTKGAVSEKEWEGFLAASPGLRKTREGNLLLWKYANAVAKRAMDRAQFYGERFGKQPNAQTEAEWRAIIEAPENNLFDKIKGSVKAPGTGSGRPSDINAIMQKHGVN